MRRGVVLFLTTLGVLVWAEGVREDPMAMSLSLALGCWGLAWVYWRITEPPRRD